MTVEIITCDHGTPAWYTARLGLPTASEFSSILAKGEGKTRLSYMRKLASEIVTGQPVESFTTQAMERGKVMEAEARELYAFIQKADLTQVGFVRNGTKGASPDSLIGTDGGLEIKTQRGDLLVETILKDKFPAEHMAQVQGNIWVCERDWWDLAVFWPGMPRFVKRVYRDEVYIATLSDAVDAFNEELAAMVAKVRAYK